MIELIIAGSTFDALMIAGSTVAELIIAGSSKLKDARLADKMAGSSKPGGIAAVDFPLF